MSLLKKLLFTFGIISTLSSTAQQDMMLYNVSQVPQSSYLNPAIFPETRVNIGIPGVNNFVRAGKSGFQTTDAFSRNEENRLQFNSESMLNSFDERNELRFSSSTDLLHVGIESGLNYFQFNVTEHVGFDLDFPREAAVLIREIYEERFFNQNINVQDVRFTGRHYREFGLGYARRLTRRLNIGVRLKYLYGISSFTTRQNNFFVDTELSYADGNNTVGGGLDYRAQTAGMDAYSSDSERPGLLYGLSNAGFAADLGIKYELTNFLEVSAATQNLLGFIYWQDDVKNYEQNGREIEIDPLDMVDMFDEESEDYTGINQQFEALLDSLIGGEPNENSNAFTTQLPARINLGAALNISNALTLNVLNQNVIHSDAPNRVYLKTMLHAKLKRFFTAIVAYDVINDQVSSRNLGLGFALNAGFLQFYGLIEDAFIITGTNERVNGGVRFGMNLTFGRDNL